MNYRLKRNKTEKKNYEIDDVLPGKKKANVGKISQVI